MTKKEILSFLLNVVFLFGILYSIFFVIAHTTHLLLLLNNSQEYLFIYDRLHGENELLGSSKHWQFARLENYIFWNIGWLMFYLVFGVLCAYNVIKKKKAKAVVVVTVIMCLFITAMTYRYYHLQEFSGDDGLTEFDPYIL